VGNFVIPKLDLELAILSERRQVTLVVIERLLRLQPYIIVGPEKIIEGGIEFTNEESVAQIAIFLILRGAQQGIECSSATQTTGSE
jgi:hypothetical protein